MKTKIFFVVMTVSLLVLLSMTVAKAQWGAADHAVLLNKIKATVAYKNAVKAAELKGHGFSCRAVEEILNSKNYSTTQSFPSIYTLVVVDCIYSPRDGLGPIKYKGLATLALGQIVNFVVADVFQAE